MEEFYKYLNDKINTNSTNDANSIHFWNDEWNVMDKSAKTYSYDCCKNCPIILQIILMQVVFVFAHYLVWKRLGIKNGYLKL